MIGKVKKNKVNVKDPSVVISYSFFISIFKSFLTLHIIHLNKYSQETKTQTSSFMEFKKQSSYYLVPSKQKQGETKSTDEFSKYLTVQHLNL